MAKIVVGVDGSEHARAALDWAIGEARLRAAPLVVASAWHVPLAAYGAPGFAPAVTPSLPESIRLEAERVARESAQQAREGGVDRVEEVVREGQAADVLTQAAADAELLVVGSRGHGGFAGLLLGSVGHQCTHHSPCPVVIVRGPARDSA